ncbi:MAG: chemotaxis protein CheD [Betaproteobacteria bacterium]
MQTPGPLIRIGMAESGASKAPATLITSGLGSCIGVALHDPQAKVGGMCHVMLPDSLQARASENRAKFADTAIPDILVQLERLGARRERLVVKVAGGAQMFSFGKGDDRFAIGRRNVEAVRTALRQAGLRIAAEDTGGNHGRTMVLDVGTGRVTIRTIESGETEL